MKTTKKEAIEKAKQLADVIEARRGLDLIEAELKEYFKEMIGGPGALQAGQIMIIIEAQQRTMIDQKLLWKQMGSDFVEKFQKVIEVRIVSCIPMKKAV